MNIKHGLAWKLERAIHLMDPALTTRDSEFKTAVIVLALANVRPNADAVATALGYNRDLVRSKVRNLWKNGILFRKGNRVLIHGDWGNKEYGTVEFWLAVLAADDMVKRVSDEAEKGE